MTDTESCFSFLIGLVLTIITFVCSTYEPKRRPQYTNSQIRALLDEHVHSERDRAIAYDRLANQIKFEQLAEKYELSVRQVKKIAYKCEKIVFEKIPE